MALRSSRTSAPASRPSARPARKRRATPPGEAFERLLAIMATLRGPHGCAWDREQTHQSLRGYLLEEAYEAVDAIDSADLQELCGELGDVLLQCVFHAQLAAEAGQWDMAAVIAAVNDKLVRRHPHVFTRDGRPLSRQQRLKQAASTAAAVREQWARVKAAERSDAGRPAQVLAGVPKALPSLLRAHKIGARAASVGFDWPSADDVLKKIEEEVRELRAALKESRSRAADEMGDVLFSIANLARKLGIEPETALAAANDKFTRRFDAVEAWLETRGRSVHDATAEELEATWNAIKVQEAPAPAIAGPSTSAGAPSGHRSRGARRRPGRS